MAKYPLIITTKIGRDAIAEANASKQPLIFTKIGVGDGDSPANIELATNVTNKLLDVDISDYRNDGNGQFSVTGSLSNKNLEKGFYAREVGLYAKVGEYGDEVLFSYTNGGNYVDYIPSKETQMDSYTFTITTVIGNAEQLKVVVNDKGYVSVGALAKHNEAPDAHDSRFKALEQSVNSTANTKLTKGTKDYVKDVRYAEGKVKTTFGNGDVSWIDIFTDTDLPNRQDWAPRLSLVKSLLSGLNIKNPQDVVRAIGSETLSSLGVRYDFSNQNAWYICLGQLFGGLIIQGGYYAENDGEGNPHSFPIAFRNKPFYMNGSADLSRSRNDFARPAWAMAINNTQFLCSIDFDKRGDGQTLNVRVLAVGI